MYFLILSYLIIQSYFSYPEIAQTQAWKMVLLDPLNFSQLFLFSRIVSSWPANLRMAFKPLAKSIARASEKESCEVELDIFLRQERRWQGWMGWVTGAKSGKRCWSSRDFGMFLKYPKIDSSENFCQQTFTLKLWTPLAWSMFPCNVGYLKS